MLSASTRTSHGKAIAVRPVLPHEGLGGVGSQGSARVGQTVELSIVVPVFNEAGGVVDLAREICVALDGRSFEVIFVDDASRDDTRALLSGLRAELAPLRLVGHRRNAGQSRAMRSGVLAARAPIIATLDGDGQNDPADIARLLQQFLRADAPHGLAMVAGHRSKRADSLIKRWTSRAANTVRKAVLRDGAVDSACGLRIMRRDAFLRLPYFDHMHRYLPALMKRDGWDIEFCEVNHRPRCHGQSKYDTLGRLRASFRDLAGVMWLMARAKDPIGVDEL